MVLYFNFNSCLCRENLEHQDDWACQDFLGELLQDQRYQMQNAKSCHMFWQAFIAQAYCQWKETLFQCSVQCGIVHHTQLWSTLEEWCYVSSFRVMSDLLVLLDQLEKQVMGSQVQRYVLYSQLLNKQKKHTIFFYVSFTLTWCFRVTVAILALLGHLGQKVKDILDQWWVY